MKITIILIFFTSFGLGIKAQEFYRIYHFYNKIIWSPAALVEPSLNWYGEFYFNWPDSSVGPTTDIWNTFTDDHDVIKLPKNKCQSHFYTKKILIGNKRNILPYCVVIYLFPSEIFLTELNLSTSCLSLDEVKNNYSGWILYFELDGTFAGANLFNRGRLILSTSTSINEGLSVPY
ncbi:MAG: hypothetical protein LIO77_02945 [Rikenellaceae bacterium]|nr:hypothetical protein [Rikenellaceae bacterium]